MATSAQPESVAAASSHDEASRYIDERIRWARRRVLWVEWFAALMTLLAAGLACLLLLVVVDHWIIPLRSWMRWLAFAGLACGASLFAWFRLAPLAIRRINPLYAARAIEENSPSLKNSVINFLLFRKDREGLQDAVYATLQRRAASDLHAVNLDATIDATPAIRVAYVLIAVLVLAAAYTILSPKDSLQSVARVAQPWSGRTAPTRVRITSVEPGRIELNYGDHVTIRAMVDGLRDSDTVVVRYSTADRQLVDRDIPMTLADDGLVFEATLPPEADGVRQDLSYRVVAGDAQSSRYTIHTSAAASMVVEQVRYDFPPYTRLSPQIQERQGDLRALEGARVTLQARANRDMQSAFVAWDPKEGTNGETLRMQVSERKAIAEFPLALTPAGVPEHSTYQLRFLGPKGKLNKQPITHQVHVIRDLPPVVELLNPERRRVEVPLNGSLKVEMRAIDPDFGLARIGLRVVVGETEVSDSKQHPVQGQVIEAFQVIPGKLGLAVGDEATFYGFAEDNRETFDRQPIPNVERTPMYVLVVTEPDPSKASSDDKADKQLKEEPQSGDKNDGDKQDGDKQDGDKQDGDKQYGDKQDGDKQDGDKQDGDKKDGDKQDGDKQSGDKQDGDKQDGDKKDGDQGDGDQNDGREKDGSTKSGAKDDPGSGGSGEKSSGDGQGDKQSGDDGEGSAQGDQSTGSGGQGSEDKPMGDGGGAASGPGSATEKDPMAPPSKDGESGVGDKGSAAENRDDDSPQSAGSGEPDLSEATPNDGPLNDGDAVETIREHIERSKGRATGEKRRSEDQSLPENTDNATRTEGGEKGRSVPEGQEVPDPKDPPGDGREAGTRASKAGDGASQKDPNGQGDDSLGAEKPASQQSSQGAEGAEKQVGQRVTDDADKGAKPGQGDSNASDADSQGQKPGDEAGGASDAGAGEERVSPDDLNGRPRPDVDNNRGKPRKGGSQAQEDADQRSDIREVESGSDANLEYANEATDLVLDYLKEHPEDQQLLDKLNWTEQDRRRFIERWTRLKQSAKEGDEGARRLSDALEGLGVRRGDDSVRRQNSQDGAAGGLRQEGAAPVNLPPHLLERFNSYKRGAAKADR